MKCITLVLLALTLTAKIACATSYRQVVLLIDNQTLNVVTFQGYAAISGTWMQGYEPEAGSVIAPYSMSVIKAGSSDIGIGTEGFLRLVSADDVMRVSWNVPWMGAPRVQVSSSYHAVSLKVIPQIQSGIAPVYHVVINE